eukprot:15478495-Alexandrium_andersonii.AAC.1
MLVWVRPMTMLNRNTSFVLPQWHVFARAVKGPDSPHSGAFSELPCQHTVYKSALVKVIGQTSAHTFAQPSPA